LEIPRWLGSKESEGRMRFNWNFWRVEEGSGWGVKLKTNRESMIFLEQHIDLWV